MFGFSFIGSRSFWLETKTNTGGQFVDGKWVDGIIEYTYTEYQCMREPYPRGNASEVLPAGVKSSDTYIISTFQDLKVHEDSTGIAHNADVIYFSDPQTDSTAQAYIVFDKEEWEDNTGFQLISSGHGRYICIRREKVM